MEKGAYKIFLANGDLLTTQFFKETIVRDIMIVFELTMPNFNTWNGHWSGEHKRFIRVKRNDSVPKERVGEDYYYDFGDGWGANVEVSMLPAAEARKLEKKSSGFMGYEWMIESIIKHGEIRKPKY